MPSQDVKRDIECRRRRQGSQGGRSGGTAAAPAPASAAPSTASTRAPPSTATEGGVNLEDFTRVDRQQAIYRLLGHPQALEALQRALFPSTTDPLVDDSLPTRRRATGRGTTVENADDAVSVASSTSPLPPMVLGAGGVQLQPETLEYLAMASGGLKHPIHHQEAGKLE